MRVLFLSTVILAAAGCKSERGACVDPNNDSWCSEDVTVANCPEEYLQVDKSCADEGFAVECAEHPNFGYMMWAVDQDTCDLYLNGGDTDPS